MSPSRFGELLDAVQHNCLVSDARHAGDNALCIFMLKMRELYRWEHGIGPTGNLSKDAVGAWMLERERLWETVEEDELRRLPLAAGSLDPFDVPAVNHALLADGCVYSGGYGRHAKPLFFLGRLLRQETRDGHDVLVAGCEYARDLEAPPGMLLNNTVFVRTEALQAYILEKWTEWQWSRHNPALGRALAAYPFDTRLVDALAQMTQAETETVILHELGEARAGAEFGSAWEALLTDVAGSRTEIMLRAVRDLYADCASTLPTLLERGEVAPIHFWFANYQGMRRELAPGLAQVYRTWADDAAPASATALGQAVAAAAAHWRGVMHAVMAQAGADDPAALKARIEAVILH